jgi:hypothetical protein
MKLTHLACVALATFCFTDAAQAGTANANCVPNYAGGYSCQTWDDTPAQSDGRAVAAATAVVGGVVLLGLLGKSIANHVHQEHLKKQAMQQAEARAYPDKTADEICAAYGSPHSSAWGECLINVTQARGA